MSKPKFETYETELSTQELSSAQGGLSIVPWPYEPRPRPTPRQDEPYPHVPQDQNPLNELRKLLEQAKGL